MKSGDLIKRQLGLDANATDEETGIALRRALFEPEPTTAVVDDPQADFERLAELYAKTHSVSLSEGYRGVSRQAPTLYERATDRARLS